MTIPARTRVGEYFVLICADAANVVREANERNNCRASAGKMRVVTPNPISVAPTLEPARAKTQTITAAAGGTISVAASSGAKLTLAIPAGAVFSDLAVTLTPVRSIGRLPLSGRLVGAVDMKPEGLYLLKGATLTITPGPGISVPIRSQIGFGYPAAGAEFHLAPMLPVAEMKMDVTHFSTSGVGEGTATDQAAQQSKTPTAAADEAAQKMAGWLSIERQCQFAGAGCIPPETLREAKIEIARILYTKRVRPLMTLAETNDFLIPDAVGEFLSWLRQLELEGLTGEFQTEIDGLRTSLGRALKNAFEKAFQKCVGLHDFTQVQRILAIEHIAKSLGLNLPLDSTERIQKCVRFELDFWTRVRFRTRSDPGVQIGPDLRVLDLPLRTVVAGDGFGIQGEKALDFYAYTLPVGCGVYKGVTLGLPFRVQKLLFDLNLFDGQGGWGRRSVELLFSHGSASELFNFRCSTPRTNFVYFTGFSELHRAERAPGAVCEYWTQPQTDVPPPTVPHVFLLRDWSVPAADLFATKTYSRTVTQDIPAVCGTGTQGYFVGEMAFEIKHTPVL